MPSDGVGDGGSVVLCVWTEPLEKGHLFSAKYVPFTPTDVDETYSLDEVIYRCAPTALSPALPAACHCSHCSVAT
jgi:hypothetical protein